MESASPGKISTAEFRTLDAFCFFSCFLPFLFLTPFCFPVVVLLVSVSFFALHEVKSGKPMQAASLTQALAALAELDHVKRWHSRGKA